MKKLFPGRKPIIAVVYLPPMPGYEKHPGMRETLDFVFEQVALLEDEGIDGVLLENENDHPYKILAPPEVISAMTLITGKVTGKFKKIKVGVEFLLNDPKASLAIAKMGDAHFIRTDYFVDKMKRDEYGGEMHIDPKGLVKYRKQIKAGNIHMFTDIQVKYAQMLEENKPLEASAKQAMEFQSSAVVVSGDKTGEPPNPDQIRRLKEKSADIPILIGSGLNAENINSLFKHADGAIVGSSMMEDGVLIREKVKKLVLGRKGP